MKKLLSVLALLLAVSAFTFAQNNNTQNAEEVKEEVKGPQLTFETADLDYGTIEQGSDPFRSMKFTNTGTEDLLITGARGSCGCTVPTYPKKPIPPGETAEIKVRYDTNRIGPFTKRVTLTTNATQPTLSFNVKGVVQKKEMEEGTPQNKSMFNNGGN